MAHFEAPGDKADLRFWRGELIVGERSAVERMCEAHESD